VTRILSAFALAVLLTGALGCGLRPVGPMAKVLPQPTPKPPPAPPSTKGSDAMPPAVLPTPTAFVSPEAVTPENAHALAAKLTEELTADANATKAPVTAEVSRLKAQR
jgi:hypothetical protein